MPASQDDESARLCARFEQRGYAVFQRGGVPSPAPAPVIYLHGFALCLSEVYEQNLIRLVDEGCVVFLPDFQRNRYHDTRHDAAVPPRQPRAAWSL